MMEVEYLGVLDCWSEKTSYLNMSPLVWEMIIGNFTIRTIVQLIYLRFNRG